MFSPYSVADIKRLCAEYRIRPTKSRGQNFLIDESIADAVITAAGVDHRSTVVEVGPGLGALTFKLAERAGEVTALEIDAKLVRVLRSALQEKNIANVQLIETDAIRWWRTLDISPARGWSASGGKCRNVEMSSVVASLPYSITSDFFSCVLRDACLPKTLTVMVQKEVAERMAARPPYMSMMALVAQWFGEVTVMQRVPRSAFWPQPEVESAIVKINTRVGAENFLPLRMRCDGISSDDFLSFVRKAFQHPRRKIGNTLSYVSPLLGRETILSKRPGEVTLEEWLSLYKSCKKL